MNLRHLFILLVILILTACSSENSSQQKPLQQQGMVLLFNEQELGTEIYPVRMIVTKNFLRIDSGQLNDDYLLFNRQEKKIFSIAHEARSILQIAYQAVKLPADAQATLTVKKSPQDDVPKFSGKTPQHVSLMDGEKVCFNVVAVEGIYPDVVQAMRSYHQTLATSQAVNLDTTPQEMRTPCMLARFVYAPDQYLDFGLPLREWDSQGYLRELLNIEEINIDSTMLTLPEDYQSYQITAEGMQPVN